MIVYIFITLFIIYLYFRERYKYIYIKEKSLFELYKLDEEIKGDPNNVLLYCRRAYVYQLIQNFEKSSKEFEYALTLIDEGKLKDYSGESDDTLRKRINSGIIYNEKPFPGAGKGPKNKTDSIFYFAMIDRIGYLRYTFKRH